MKHPTRPELRVKIWSPTQTYYHGLAMSVSARNKVGPFDILSGHANFFTMLEEGHIVVNDGYQNFSFPINKGIMKVSNNEVTLFVDIEPVYGEINTPKS